MNRLSEKKKEIGTFLIMLILILGITGLPYLKRGLMGWFPDLMYHLLRIEAVKEALAGGEFLPRIYELFFNGYGYGSPLFYPDIFLVYPAFLRLLGIGPLMTWKIFALSITAVATCTTYFSFKYICRNWKFSIAGTCLLMLSQFYLADLINRLGISEYLAFIFMPILFAGLYDFLVYGGRKVYLLGIAFCGLVLSHTIMTMLGILITVVFFVIALLLPSVRKEVLNWKKLRNLGITALITVFSVSYYIFPMIEQMLDGEFLYQTPWAHVGDHTQPYDVFFNFTGYFDLLGYVGVGIPILMLIACRFIYGKPENKWADIFFFSGIVMFVITTDIFPWKMLNDTFFNMIQFTYRIYPYALCSVILGIILLLVEKCRENPAKMVIFISVSALFFGFCQNYYLPADGVHTESVTEEYLYENSNHVSMGEWLPAAYNDAVRNLEADGRVYSSRAEAEFIKNGYNDYSFLISSEEQDTYVLPLIYYKGYGAELCLENGEKIELPVSRTEDCLVQVLNDSGLAGYVKVSYGGTWVQTVSNVISSVVVCGVMIGAGLRVYKQKGSQKQVKKVA